jgi:hypothetical protein
VSRFFFFHSLALALLLMLAACAPGQTIPPAPETAPTARPAGANQADLSAVKDYALANASKMKTGSDMLLATAEAYYELLEGAGFDYQAAWTGHQTELADLVATAKEQWLETSLYYELNEGIIAGVPSLSYYDVLIDAGPSGAEAPQEALDWMLELPNGEKLEKPGNYFHSLLEPTLWGTEERFTGLPVDLDGNGQVELGEALPDANLFLGAARGLNDATQEMITAVQDWQPTQEDAFTALAVMIPTMNEYFEQWKLSSFIAGENFEEKAFIGTSRLFDITNILHGLDVTYHHLSPQVVATNAELDQQIQTGFDQLTGFVNDLYSREQQGERFTADQADLFGSEAQDRATALVAQVTQAAALLNVEIEN